MKTRITSYEIACRIWAGASRENLYGSDEIPHYGLSLVSAHRSYRAYHRSAKAARRQGMREKFGKFEDWARAYQFAVAYYGFTVFVNKCKYA